MPARPKQRCTMLDVARASKVSVATVSRALSDSPLIPKLTRKRVKAAALRLRYAPKIAAISLRGGKTPVVGVFTYFGESGWPAQHILWGLSDEIHRTRKHMVIYPSESFPGTRRRFEQIIDQGILGSIVVVGHPVISAAPLQRALDWGIPVVTLEYKLSRAHSVHVDNIAGGRLAAQRLALGSKHFLIVLPESEDPLALLRAEGFRTELERLGHPASAVETAKVPWATVEAGEELGRHLMVQRGGGLGIFCTWGDLAAFGLMRSLNVRGFRLISDFRLVGYDDLTFTRYFSPGLTTIRQPFIEMGRAAGALAIAGMKDSQADPVHRMLQPELVVRETA